MGQCCHKEKRDPNAKKQNKNIDDRGMLKVGIEVLKKDFCVQIGYNRQAVKTYSNALPDEQNNEVEPEEPTVS